MSLVSVGFGPKWAKLRADRVKFTLSQPVEAGSREYIGAVTSAFTMVTGDKVLIEHDRVEEVLSALGSTLRAAEAHGVLCGLLCASTDGRTSGQLKSDWFRELLTGAGLAAGDLTAHAEGLKLLDGLFATTVEGLNAEDLNFRLLLADDSMDLDRRFVQLSYWCSGFCFGFGLATGGHSSADSTASLPADTRELLDDFGNIARSVGDPLENAIEDQIEITEDSSTEAFSEESDEEALTELEEYVRVGTLLINEEMRPITPVSRTLH